MLTRYTYKNLTWIDLEKPTNEEVRGLMEEFDIHPIAADELLGPSLRPKVDHYENFIYLILHFPAIRHSHGTSTTQEIDFIIGKEFLITAHYEMIDPLHKFAKVFEVNSILDKALIGDHAGFLFFFMARKIYGSLTHELSVIGDALDTIEEQIFHGEERKMVKELSAMHRDILAFRKAIRMHPHILNSFSIAAAEFFGKDFKHYAENITGEYYKIEELLEDEQGVLNELRETNNSLLTTKTNEIMKALTIINVSILPASLIAQAFAMDSKNNPIVGDQYDFWIIIGIMLVVALMSFLIFKEKKWF